MADEDRENDELKAFAEALRSLRPRTGQIDTGLRSLLAKDPDAIACDGHLLLCIRCGKVLPTEDRAADAALIRTAPRGKCRWLWPAACAAMTTVAAGLLVAMVICREGAQKGTVPFLRHRAAKIETAPQTRSQSRQLADHGGPPSTASHVAAANQTRQVEEAENPMPPGFSRWAVSRTSGSGQRILSVGDANLPDALLQCYFSPQNDASTGRKLASTGQLEMAEAALTNHDLLQRLLKLTEGSGDPSRSPNPKPFHVREEAL